MNVEFHTSQVVLSRWFCHFSCINWWVPEFLHEESIHLTKTSPLSGVPAVDTANPYCQETQTDRTVNLQLGVHSRCFPLRTPFFCFPNFLMLFQLEALVIFVIWANSSKVEGSIQSHCPSMTWILYPWLFRLFPIKGGTRRWYIQSPNWQGL